MKEQQEQNLTQSKAIDVSIIETDKITSVKAFACTLALIAGMATSYVVTDYLATKFEERGIPREVLSTGSIILGELFVGVILKTKSLTRECKDALEKYRVRIPQTELKIHLLHIVGTALIAMITSNLVVSLPSNK